MVLLISPVNASDQRNPAVERLIDHIVELGRLPSETYSTVWAGDFVATEQGSPSEDGRLQARKRKGDPGLRSLVRLGVRALPGLIAHLSDPRRTGLVEGDHKADYVLPPLTFADQYQPRFGDSTRRSRGVNFVTGLSSLREPVPSSIYTFRVGDLCYDAIGMIVNRDLSCKGYPRLINSPVHSPDIARAVAKDWGGLTSDGHRKQLEDDAYSLWPFTAAQAIRRLLFYYPETGERIVARLLHRKLYDSAAVWDFATDQLMKSDHPAVWRRLKGKAERLFGSDAASLLSFWIYWDYNLRDHPKIEKDRAARLLKTVFPDFSPNRNRFYDSGDFFDQTDLVSSIKPFHSTKIDASVQELFERLRTLPIHGTNDAAVQRRIGRDGLAIVCAQRMKGKGFDAEYADYFAKRVAEIRSLPKDAPEKDRLNQMLPWANSR